MPHSPRRRAPGSTASSRSRWPTSPSTSLEREATVTLDLASDPARLSVHNTLTHAVGNPNGGSGLRGMSERAAHLGARFSAGPDANGWRVLVELANPHAHNCPLPKLPVLPPRRLRDHP